MTIHYVRQGQGKPLVLFHGWGFDHQIWQPIVPCLEKQFEVYQVDLPGFGLTDDMDWNAFKTGLLNHLPLSFALVGWSLGGLYATRLALDASDRVTHLCSVASSPYFMQVEAWPGVTTSTMTSFFQRLGSNVEKTLNQFISLQTKDTGLTSYSMRKRPSDHALRQGLDNLMTWDFRDHIQHLKMPACYLFGKLDAIIPHKVMQVMQNKYPNLTYRMINKAAHMPFISHKDDFLTIIKEFIL